MTEYEAEACGYAVGNARQPRRPIPEVIRACDLWRFAYDRGYDEGLDDANKGTRQIAHEK